MAHLVPKSLPYSYLLADGIEALGTGFPAIPRKDLMVLPDDVWRREEGRLTYQVWAEKTKLAEQLASRRASVNPLTRNVVLSTRK